MHRRVMEVILEWEDIEKQKRGNSSMHSPFFLLW